IKHPRDAGLKVGDIVKAQVKEIDLAKKRISLTLRKKTGQKQKFKSKDPVKPKRDHSQTFRKKKPISAEDRKMESLFKNRKIKL
ncbi:MAG: hypothetical protein ACW97X_14175, partial [Candidatus Hodarchaeales archaeon]